MKIIPTLEGGLRIDVEDSSDWVLLKHISHDAVSHPENLAERLGQLITEPDLVEDWRDFVLPDLDHQFTQSVLHVSHAISAARLKTTNDSGVLWITREDALDWYSTLNQARLALEERYHFGVSPQLNPAKLNHSQRSIFLRSQFYSAIQSLLLDHVMKY